MLSVHKGTGDHPETTNDLVMLTQMPLLTRLQRSYNITTLFTTLSRGEEHELLNSTACNTKRQDLVVISHSSSVTFYQDVSFSAHSDVYIGTICAPLCCDTAQSDPL